MPDTTASRTAGPLMLDLEGLELDSQDVELLQRPSVGGLILFSRNYASVNQLRELVGAIRSARPGILIAVDQEGGRVQRFREGFSALPPLNILQARYAQNVEKALADARELAWLMATEILDYGLDFSFAPVLDLFTVDSRVIGDRAFSANPQEVSELAQAYISGMHDAGMAATGKHFPGHGSVSADSHLELPEDTRTLEQIAAADLIPFKACAQSLDAVMPAHILYSQVDGHCAGFSPYWLQQVLRQQLGFEGVIFSDDLSMQAAHSVGDCIKRCELALAAGCDMVLLCNDRASAIRCADFLDNQNLTPNPVLGRMRARKNIVDDANARNERQLRWQAFARRLGIDVDRKQERV